MTNFEINKHRLTTEIYSSLSQNHYAHGNFEREKEG